MPGHFFDSISILGWMEVADGVYKNALQKDHVYSSQLWKETTVRSLCIPTDLNWSARHGMPPLTDTEIGVRKGKKSGHKSETKEKLNMLYAEE